MTMFVDSTSDIRTPPQVSLRSNSGAVLRTIEKNTVAALKEYALGEISFHQVKTRDGVTMDAAMIKPPDFDPKKKYPVMSFCYAGPGAQSVRNRWGRTTIMWYHLLAQNGYVIWVCDNRSASARGVVSQQGVFRNFGVQEMSDLEDGAAWLKAQSFVDGSRIGLWGWSYGGFMASFALTHSTTFKIGVAGAPVTDWRLYDSIYTERYMGLPSANPEGYDRTSVLKAADKLNGKLLLIHGAVDNNVHPQNSVRLIDALQKSGKQFRFMLYPQSQHGVTNPMRVKHMNQMVTDFILENL
jgi:dipeptidyl-peptidase-4